MLKLCKSWSYKKWWGPGRALCTMSAMRQWPFMSFYYGSLVEDSKIYSGLNMMVLWQTIEVPIEVVNTYPISCFEFRLNGIMHCFDKMINFVSLDSKLIFMTYDQPAPWETDRVRKLIAVMDVRFVKITPVKMRQSFAFHWLTVGCADL